MCSQVEGASDPMEDLDVPPRIAADRDREPEVPRAWSARSFRQQSSMQEGAGAVAMAS